MESLFAEGLSIRVSKSSYPMVAARDVCTIFDEKEISLKYIYLIINYLQNHSKNFIWILTGKYENEL